jgi:hypothetical protein
MYKEICNINVDDVEYVLIEINLPHTKPILLGTVYRAPDANADYLSKVDLLFQNCTSSYNDVIFVGDYNLDICKRINSSKVNNLAKHSNLCQLIKDYTRVTGKTKTKIDFIFVTNSDKVSDSGVHSLGLSDHSLTYIVRKNKKVKPAPKTIKSCSFKNFNDDDFVDYIKNIDWNSVMCCSDVDSAWLTWKQLFSKACDMHAPIKDKKVSVSLPEWITSDYIRLR